MEVLLRGVLEKKCLLDLTRHFIVFEDNGKKTEKKVAEYHQFHAVNKTVERTLDAASLEGDRRVGVVWHTQGSGKSLTRAFYAGKIIQHLAMSNPTHFKSSTATRDSYKREKSGEISSPQAGFVRSKAYRPSGNESEPRWNHNGKSKQGWSSTTRAQDPDRKDSRSNN